MRVNLRKIMIFISRKKQERWLSKILKLAIKLLKIKRKKDKKWAMGQIQIQIVMTSRNQREGRFHRNNWKKYSNSKRAARARLLLLKKLRTKSGNRSQSYKCIEVNQRNQATLKSFLEMSTNQTKVKVTL